MDGLVHRHPRRLLELFRPFLRRLASHTNSLSRDPTRLRWWRRCLSRSETFWGRRWGTLQRQLPLLLLKARKMDLYIYNWDTLTKRKRSATKNEKWSLSKWKCSRHSNSEMLFRNDIRNEIDICFHRFLKNYRFHFYMFGWISRINYQLWFDPIRTFFFQNLMMKITTHMIKFIRISHQSCLLRTKVPEHRHILQLPSKVFSGHVEQIIS